MAKHKATQPTDSELNTAIQTPTADAQAATDGNGQTQPDDKQDRMAVARAARQTQTKEGKPRSVRMLYLCKTTPEGKIDRILKGYANKFRLRRELDVYYSIDPALVGRLTVLRAKRVPIEEILE